MVELFSVRMSTIKIDKRKLEHLLRKQAGRMLFELATKAMRMLQMKLSTPYPPASRRGQWPRRRTGTLRRSVFMYPNSISGIQAQGSVRVGYDSSGSYGDKLVHRGRKGPADALKLIHLPKKAFK